MLSKNLPVKYTQKAEEKKRKITLLKKKSQYPIPRPRIE
jgi:hypothetical protein